MFRSPVFVFEVFRHYLWLDGVAPYYRPVQNLSYMLDYAIWGEWFTGYRITSLLAHGLSGVLLWRLFAGVLKEWRLGGEVGLGCVVLSAAEVWSYVAVFAWLIHPAHNPAVAYVSGRADSLAAFFALAGWLAWRARGMWRPPVRAFLLVAFVWCWVLALCSRETALVWLLVFVMYEGGLLPWRPNGRWGVWLISAALFAGYVWLRSLPDAVWPGGGGAESLASRVGTAFLAVGDYAMLYVLPLRLAMERALVVEGGGVWQLVVAALAGLAVLVWLAWLPGRMRTLRRWSVCVVFLGYLPVSPVFATNAAVAEHWMYLPFAFLTFAVVLGVAELPMRMRKLSLLALAVWIPFLGVRTFLKSFDWRDNARFIEQTLVEGGGTGRMQGLAAANLARAGREDAAEDLLREAIRDHPGNELLPVFLGTVLASDPGSHDEAMKLLDLDAAYLRKKRGEHPLYAMAPLHAARIEIERGEIDAALDRLGLARSLWPDDWRVYRETIRILLQLERHGEMVEILRAFTQRNPWHLDAQLLLARMLALEGAGGEAVGILEKARWLDIRSPDADRLRAGVHSDRGQWAEAEDAQRDALARSGGALRDASALAAVLERRGKLGEAAEIRKRAASGQGDAP